MTSEAIGLKCIIQTHCIKAAKKLIENLFDDMSDQELLSVRKLIEDTLEISQGKKIKIFIFLIFLRIQQKLPNENSS